MGFSLKARSERKAKTVSRESRSLLSRQNLVRAAGRYLGEIQSAGFHLKIH
jgi:hypothetical protein